IGAPRPPEKVTAVAGDRIVSIGWAPNPEANIIGYNIYYKEATGKEFKKLNKEPIMEETKFKAILNNDVTYNFVVTAVNNRKLESVYSEVVSATPQKYVPKKPSVVTGVMAKVEDTSIVVMWNESKEDFVVGYNLYYKKSGDTYYKRLNKGLLRETKATLAGLKAKIMYSFVVTAVSKDGIESDFSESVSERIETEEYY
ncbi:MAG: fibronectin type III domain-containing protein, partial [Candidatus Goldbacteria bacterium]|nr:fibronectin type III domain-containing protein [Candidatus Goldiibacteriota bacterium]